MRALLIGLLMLALLPRCALADDVVRPINPGGNQPWSFTAYEFAVLQEVLERTRSDYGTYEIQPFAQDVSIARAVQLAIEGRLVNILAAGVGLPALERDMIPVPFPIDKGLLGYRISLIDRGDQDSFARVNNIEDLRHLRIGQGTGWADVQVYEYNRIPVETAPDYKSLFSMLLHGRFDLFPKGLSEIDKDLADYGKDYPAVAVEQHILLHYPFCDVFYVSQSSPGLGERLTAGLERMAADGSFDALFAKHFGKTLAELNLRQRVVIELENPFLPAWVPLDRKELWFDPARLP